MVHAFILALAQEKERLGVLTTNLSLMAGWLTFRFSLRLLDNGLLPLQLLQHVPHRLLS